jgi:hypothetical protein
MVYFGEYVNGHGAMQCGGQTHFLQPCIHKIKVVELIHYPFGPCCLDMCAKVVRLRHFPILQSYV